MSYLRPTCSDAAVRVTNLGLSRCMSLIAKGDAQDENVASTVSYNDSQDTASSQRRPSRRPLDRRWDESRGLLFAERKHALNNNTWTPARGIVFASNVGQRRAYAMRPNRAAPGTQNAPGSTSGASGIYGSGNMPSLERPSIPTPSTASKGFKQEQMEKELLEAGATIEGLEKRMRDFEEQIKALQVQLKEEKKALNEKHTKTQKDLTDESERIKKALREEMESIKRTFKADKKSMEQAFNDERQSIHSRALADGRAEANAKTDADMEKYRIKHYEMQKEVEKAKAEFPELRKRLTVEISQREAAYNSKIGRLDADLQAKKKRAEAERERIFREANDWDTEVKLRANDTNQKLETWATDLRLREDALQGRKAQRSSYQSYRDLYSTVHAERRDLIQRLGIVQAHLFKERENLERGKHDQNTDSEDAVLDRSLMIGKLNDLERGIDVIRRSLTALDESLQRVGHISRLQTNMTRFKDTTLAGEVMSAVVYPATIEPLKSVSKSIRRDIDDMKLQIQNASDATIRAELQAQKDAYFTEKVAMDQAIDFAYLHHDISVFQAMKLEPYINKATQLATFDLQRQIASVSAHAHEGHQVSIRRDEWDRLRDTRDVTYRLVKKQSILSEVMGRHEEDEKRLDDLIDERIAGLEDEIRALRASYVKSRRELRDALKRASSTLAPPSSIPKSSSSRSKTGSPASSRALQLSREAGKTSADPDKTALTGRAQEIVKLKQQILEAEEAGDSNRVITLTEQLLQARANYSGTMMRLITRKKAALGPKTPENADLHQRLEHHINLQKMGQLNYQLGEAKRAGEMDDVKSLGSERDSLRAQISGYVAQLNASRQPKTLENGEEHESPDLERSASKPSFRTRRQRLRKSQTSRREHLFSEENDLQSKAEDALSSLEHADDKGPDKQASRALDDGASGVSSQAATAEDTSRESTADKSDPSAVNFVSFRPTLPRQATCQPSGRKQLHDDVLWAEFLSQQQARESAVLSVSNTSSVEQTDSSFYVSDSGAVDGHTSEVCPEDARDDHNAKNHTYAASASLSSDISSLPTSHNFTPNTADSMAEQDADFVPTYEISSEDKKNALIASRNSTASFWKYSLYKNATGETPTRHYCTTYEQVEAQVEKFRGTTVVGFDLEWERFKSKAGEDSAKRCVSLMQLAAEDKVALFHLAVFRGGDSVADMVPPSLRAMLEDPNVIKVGVNIGGDATRLRNVFGIEMQGNIELSHLYKLVKFGESQREKVNKGLQSLAKQVEEILHLPLAKGAVRTSSWSKRLNLQQIEYATSDAYAGLRLYYELERRRKAMDPRPPRPAFHELGLPIKFGDGEVALPKSMRGKQTAETIDESLDEPIKEAAALQEQDDANEDSDDIYDDPADLEAFDELLESQDANAALPEITYPKLPPLDDVSDNSSDIGDDSSLPSDPLTKPSSSTRAFHSPEAATADAWATAWQSQLPATQNTRVSLANLRAYHLWHHQGFDLQEIAALLRKEPLALSTVVSYIAEVVQKEDLDFDAERLREVRARLPASVRSRYAKLYAGAGTDGA